MSGDNNQTILHPPILWAQRKDKLYVTVDVEDLKEEVVKIDDKSLYFKAKGGAKSNTYEVSLNFLKEILPDDSKQRIAGRGAYFCLKKKEEDFWPKLLTDAKKPHWVRVDFDKWKDEDDSDVDEEKDMAFEDMMSQMGNLGTNEAGMPEPEDDEPDSDDEDLPELEETAKD